MRPVVGYIGLGDIGGPMAGRIIPGGYSLVVWNRTASKMEPFREAGAAAAKSPRDLAQDCSIICLCLNSIAAAESVIFGDDGIAGAGKNVLIVDNSTFHPEAARSLAARVSAAGMRYLDAPVSGGSHGARMGTLAIMVGGDLQDVEEARPVLMTYANRVTHMGPHGTGMAAKVCNQVMLFGTMLAIAESQSLGKRFGVELGSLPEALAGGMSDSAIYKEFVRDTTAGEDANISWHINRLIGAYEGNIDPEARGNMVVALKDTGIALDLGRAVGAPMPLTSLYDTLATMIHHQAPREAAKEEMEARR